jgi:hypothetical protein
MIWRLLGSCREVTERGLTPGPDRCNMAAALVQPMLAQASPQLHFPRAHSVAKPAHLSTVCYENLLCSAAAARAKRLHAPHHLHALRHAPKYHMLAVCMRHREHVDDEGGQGS